MGQSLSDRERVLFFTEFNNCAESFVILAYSVHSEKACSLVSTLYSSLCLVHVQYYAGLSNHSKISTEDS